MSTEKRHRNEATTRRDLIDPAISAAGWGAGEATVTAEEICPGRILAGGLHDPKTKRPCDYVLRYRGRVMATIEAKAETKSYADGIAQALDYADRLGCKMTYATDGHEIYQINMDTCKEGLVEAYPTPDELWKQTVGEKQGHTWKDQFSRIPIERKGGSWTPRYYQEHAINKALDAIASGEKRILLALATGTGKTAIAFQISWKLFYSKWNLKSSKRPGESKRLPRVLFLADRNFIADQAYNEFYSFSSTFGEDALARITPQDIKKRGSVPKNASIFFTIFQTFMSGGETTEGEGECTACGGQWVQESDSGWTCEACGQMKEGSTPYFGEYSKDFFDFIIIDECHRGGANDESSWRKILEHFSPAVQLGLTATPKRKDNVDTYAYFGDAVYKYSLQRGINDGFLTPFRVDKLSSNIDDYTYVSEDEVVVLQGDPDPKPGDVFTESDFNRKIIIEARERKRVKQWMDRIDPTQKTLVFCANQAHAAQIRNYVQQYALSQKWVDSPMYCVRVTANDGKNGERFLRAFQNNEKTIPTILTTSRKLSTGVDARNVRNIVLMRPCTNMIEFKQILGRGTRIYEGKEYFVLFDFVKAHRLFEDTGWDGEPLHDENVLYEEGSMQKKEKIEVEREGEEGRPKELIKIKLSDNKIREIRHVVSHMYWYDNKPVTAQQFLEFVFGDLPKFFKDEDELRTIWSHPTTRERLLEDITEAGYDVADIKTLIDAKGSDVFDVLAYVAYAKKTLTRSERVANAKTSIGVAYRDERQQEFIDFVLEAYIEDGVKELSEGKLKDLLILHSQGTLQDGLQKLGATTEEARGLFIGFQRYLYESDVSATG